MSQDAMDELPYETLLAPLIRALSVDGSVLSMHFADGDPGRALACTGGVVGGDLTSAIIDHASGLARRPSLSDTQLMQRAWLGRVGPDQRPLLTLVFEGGQLRSKVIFSAVFGDKGPPDRKLIVATLRRLMPMLEAYFLLWQRLRATEHRNADLHAALDAIDLGVILVDRDGAPLVTNAAAASLLREGRFLRQRGTTLHASDLRQTMRLQAALAAAISHHGERVPASQADHDAALIKLTVEDDHVIVAALSASRPADEPGAVAAMLIVLKPGGGLKTMAVSACRLFGLSSVETGLACHLAAGQSLAEASESMRIRENTARSYLKQIFAKTNVNRQIDLVRLLLSSIIRVRVGEII
jgi:PAS domain-containing protein/DNA-binding CsgD family transcriptional regulator